MIVLLHLLAYWVGLLIHFLRPVGVYGEDFVRLG